MTRYDHFTSLWSMLWQYLSNVDEELQETMFKDIYKTVLANIVNDPELLTDLNALVWPADFVDDEKDGGE